MAVEGSEPSNIVRIPLPLPGYTVDEAAAAARDGTRHRGLPYVMCYAIIDRGAALLVDPGWDDEPTYRALTDALAAIGVSLAMIAGVAVTHAHPDHIGLATRLARECRVPLIMLAAEIDSVRRTRTARFRARYLRWLSSQGVPDNNAEPWFEHAVRGPRLPPMVQAVEDGQAIRVGGRRLRVIATPGHTAGHMCIYEPASASVLVGDHILEHVTPYVGAGPDAPRDMLGRYLLSLAAIRELGAKHVLPAHQGIITDLTSRIDEIERHHQRRSREVASILARASEPMTAQAVTNHVAWAPGSLVGLPDWMQHAALVETVAHLVHGRLHGTVTSESRRGVTTWSAQQAPPALDG